MVDLVYLVLAGHEWSVERTLDAAEAALVHYSRWYGPYAYPRLTVVEVPDDGQGAGGMESPTLVTAGTLDVSGLGLDRLGLSRALEVVVVHEVGHQWWQVRWWPLTRQEPCWTKVFTDYATSRVMRRPTSATVFFAAGGRAGLSACGGPNTCHTGYADVRPGWDLGVYATPLTPPVRP